MEPQQKIRPLGLRAKILGIIAGSVVIPLATGTMVTLIIGARAYKKEKGALFQTIAVHYAKEINTILDGHARSLEEWGSLSGLPTVLAGMNQGPAPGLEELEEDISYWEERWPGLFEDLDEIQPFLTNEVARMARAFQAVNPQFVEILVTDAEGRLAGATGRVEDYWQADESWWQSAMHVRGHQPWIEGIEYDDSAGVYSIDVAVVLFEPGQPQLPIGVMKGVLEATPILGSLKPLLGQDQPISQVILGNDQADPDDNGRILAPLFEHGGAPREPIATPEARSVMDQRGQGGEVMSLGGETKELVGFASLSQTRLFSGHFLVSGLRPMYVTVHEELDLVLDPVYRQIKILAGVGGLLILFFGVLGVLAATKHIISPLQVLRAAANSISATARLVEDDEGGEAPDARSEAEARNMVERVGAINTGDEIEDLAVEFRRMADRVLNYHVQLQSELTEKTEEVQRDLAIAREFQEALLPKTYPAVPAPGAEAPLRLGFAHRYRAALSVGGDFFYVTRLTEQRAAVFITDVMGHGTRSALITAILRTLLHNLEPGLTDAGSVMSYINRQFCQSVPHGKEFIFATAFCLVLDTAAGEATCASAGHPPALRGHRSAEDVEPVLAHKQVGPALGLSLESEYPAQRLKIEAGDLFMLYTDGLIEAPDVENVGFGEQRVRDVVAAHREAGADEVCEAVMRAVARHMDTVVSPDDLCLAVVKVDPNPDPAEATNDAPDETPA